MKKLILLFLFTFFVGNIFSQHLNQYSQYMFNGLAINPAYAGANKMLNATWLYRNQWIGIDGAPKTISFSIHTPLKNKKLNLGLVFVSDRYGVTQKNSLNGIYAYRITQRHSSFSFGILGGVSFFTNKWDEIQTTTSGDAIFSGTEKSTIPQAGFGFYYQRKNFYAGISAPALLVKSVGNEYIYNPVFSTVGYLYSFSENLILKPSILVRYLKNSPVQFDINLNSYYKEFGLGFSYRTKDAVVILLQYKLNDQLNFGYSYDLTISKLRTYNNGSHEIMIRYDFGYKVNAQSPRYF